MFEKAVKMNAAQKLKVPTGDVTLKEALDVAAEELKKAPETPLDLFPDVLYVVDSTDDFDGEPDEGPIFTADKNIEDLVGYEKEVEVGIYKLVAVQRVIKEGRVEPLATTIAGDGVIELEVESDED